MKPERTRIEALFEEALERDPDERAEWLARVCGDDHELRSEVEALLAAHERPLGILEATPPAFTPPAFTPSPATPAGDAPGSARPAPAVGGPAEGPGSLVGPWRLVRELGEGGMGLVYLGERADGLFEQRVAVKVIRGGFFSDELYRRFLRERQILATLEHPNIARLLSGGLTASGRPYLVMEYVDGRPIDEYCRAGGLGVEERLRLFCAVARAVHYAHRNLVVHRDLKPSNVLVTADGIPKLLDFGIAKILDPGAEEEGAGATRSGLRPMTPEYASPEQMRGGPITTAADIYSLGVVLFELLTGRLPFEPLDRSPRQFERYLLQEEPPRPSSVVGSSRRLRRRLRGDLDRIVLMALRKEPERRYASAEGLAEDIERHLRGLPVAAHRDGRAYRAAKFVRRHRVTVAAAGLAMLSLAAGAALAARQAAVARGALARTEEALARSEAVTGFVLDLLRGADPREARADTAAARAILRRGVERVETLAGEPLVQARVLNALAEVHVLLAQYEEARALHERALALRRAGLGEEHPEVAESLDRLADVQRRLGELDAADSLLQRALRIAIRTGGERSPQVADVLYDLAYLHADRLRDGEAESLFRRVVALRRQIYGEADTMVTHAMLPLASIKRRQGQYAAAERLYREVLDTRVRTLGPEHRLVAQAMVHLGDLLWVHRDAPAEAERLYREALGMQERLLGLAHPDLVHTLNSLASLRSSSDDLDEAIELRRRSREVTRTVYGPRTAPAVMATLPLARDLMARGRIEEAEGLLREAVEVARETLTPEDPGHARAVEMLAAVVEGRGSRDGRRPESATPRDARDPGDSARRETRSADPIR